MIKKLIAFALCGILLIGAFGCASSENGTESTDDDTSAATDPADTENGGKDTDAQTGKDENGEDEQPKPLPELPTTTTALNSNTPGIKILGERMLSSDAQINCDWTCSGIEFVLYSLGGDVSFEAGSDKPCFFRAYVNGTEWKDGMFSYHTVNGESTIILEDLPTGELTIRLVKVTGHTLSRAQLYSVTYCGTIKETAPADEELYIEFIGDSISCGWGVVGEHGGAYTDQDGTYAYPYQLAQKLGADYAITALSGQGVMYHGIGIPNMLEGYLMSSPLRDSNVMYGFERKADVVVVNMGTNDYSKRGNDGINAESFKSAYKQLLQSIRKNNGETCKIVCLYNTMNDTFADSIIAACYELGGNAAGVYTFEMERAASGHPTIEENEKYIKALEGFLDEVIDGEIVESGSKLDTETSGDGLKVDISDFVPMPSDR